MKNTSPKTDAGAANRKSPNSLTHDLGRLRVGRAQVFRQIAVYPLVGETNGGPDYLTMAAALDSKVMEVTEIDEDGSVPELMVRTHSPLSILIIDGEELIGAKQNRVVNSTILLNRQAETKIPVSCTEAGRWAYKSANFASSDVVMERKARARKSRSVKQSLQSSAGHASDQSGVWDDIAELSAKACAPSPTSAMKDVFDQRRADIEGALKKFKPVPNQLGMAVQIDGKMIGFDLVSQPKAYAELHPKLIRSYVLDPLLEEPQQPAKSDVRVAREFLAQATACTEERFRSPGEGEDVRYNGTSLSGNALILDQHVIHVAFFQTENESAFRAGSIHSRRQGPCVD